MTGSAPLSYAFRIEGGASRLVGWHAEKLADANSGTAEDRSGVIDHVTSPIPASNGPTGAKLYGNRTN